MAITSEDLHRQRLAHVVARARASAAAAGELTPAPFTSDLEPLSDKAREELMDMLRPGGAYWKASAAIAASDSDLA